MFVRIDRDAREPRPPPCEQATECSSSFFDEPAAVWKRWAVAAGVAACVVGSIAHRIWGEISWPRCADLVLCTMLSLSIAWPMRRWLGASWAGALAIVWIAAAIVFCGALAFAAAILIAGAAVAVGSLLTPTGLRFRAVLSLPAGMALLAGIDGWLLPLHIHRRFVYLPLLLALCLGRRVALRAIVGDALHDLREAIAAAPLTAAFAVIALGLASTGTWLPTMQFDDLAYHLGLPSQLRAHGFYSLDPTHQIWALAPWLGDVVQAIAEVLTGGEARGAVNSIWLVAAAASTWCAATTLRTDAHTAWLAVALLASQPMLAVLAAGMQTELATLALALALTLAILRADDSFPTLIAVLAGGLVALKLGAAAIAAVLCAWALVRARARFGRAGVAAILFVLVAGSSYTYATAISGNPLLPLFNEVFHARFLAPHQLDDARWHAGLATTLPWSITFDTDQYLECWKGGFGLTLVALAGAWLCAIVAPARRGIAIAATFAFLVPLVPIQYARYAFPGLVLLLPVMLTSMRDAIGLRRTIVVASVLCTMNLALQANAGWSLRSSARARFVASGMNREAVFTKFAPERALIDEIEASGDDDSIVLALDPAVPAVAELAGRGRSLAWYDPAMNERRGDAESDPSGERWRDLILATRARWLLARSATLSGALREGLMRIRAERISIAGEAELWRVPDTQPAPSGTP
jgi:hypothetical protein